VEAVASTPATKAALRARTGAVAVDMESAAIVAMAAQAGCPALVVRAVSDRADEGLPLDLLPVLAADGRLALGAALGLLARPRVLPRAWALGRSTHRALAAVARALAALTG
jgi:adenosylhomocysteine nucleosidase